VFVADSQRDRMEANIASLKDLRDNLKTQKRKGVSFILQCNKRDLPDLMPVEEIAGILGLARVPIVEAVASKGTGVFETLRKVSRLVIARLHKQFQAAGGTA